LLRQPIRPGSPRGLLDLANRLASTGDALDHLMRDCSPEPATVLALAQTGGRRMNSRDGDAPCRARPVSR
jgi:hypothetical protein